MTGQSTESVGCQNRRSAAGLDQSRIHFAEVSTDSDGSATGVYSARGPRHPAGWPEHLRPPRPCHKEGHDSRSRRGTDRPPCDPAASHSPPTRSNRPFRQTLGELNPMDVTCSFVPKSQVVDAKVLVRERAFVSEAGSAPFPPPNPLPVHAEVRLQAATQISGSRARKLKGSSGHVPAGRCCGAVRRAAGNPHRPGVEGQRQAVAPARAFRHRVRRRDPDIRCAVVMACRLTGRAARSRPGRLTSLVGGAEASLARRRGWTRA